MGQILFGCLGWVLLYVLLPFVGGVISAFAIGGWKLGTGAILYTITSFVICSKVESKRAGAVYFLLMLPLYGLEIYGLYNGLCKNN